ncbi:MAG: hypothetical protein M1814_000438 [Vezdaea aestivalis]|nr:MAG: hypothetical protein M1814_000438 [Vezdaea aestivalis]
MTEPSAPWVTADSLPPSLPTGLSSSEASSSTSRQRLTKRLPPNPPPGSSNPRSQTDLPGPTPKKASESTASSLPSTLLYSLSADARTSRDSVRTEASSDTRKTSTQRSTSSTRSGFLSLAALAREKTSSALGLASSLRPPPSQSAAASLHSVSSSDTLTRSHSTSSFSSSGNTIRPPNTSLDTPGGEYYDPSQPASQTFREFLATSPPANLQRPIQSTRAQTAGPDPATPFDQQPYTSVLETPKAAYGAVNKMHQTSSRLLRMTEDERPFTRVSEDEFPILAKPPEMAHIGRDIFRSEEPEVPLGLLPQNFSLPRPESMQPNWRSRTADHTVELPFPRKPVATSGASQPVDEVTQPTTHRTIPRFKREKPTLRVQHPSPGLSHDFSKNSITPQSDCNSRGPIKLRSTVPLPTVSPNGYIRMDGVDRVSEHLLWQGRSTDRVAEIRSFLQESRLSPSTALPTQTRTPHQHARQRIYEQLEMDPALFHIRLLRPAWIDDRAHYSRHAVLPQSYSVDLEFGRGFIPKINIRYIFHVEALPDLQTSQAKHNGLVQARIRFAAIDLQRTQCVVPYDPRAWEDRFRLDSLNGGLLEHTNIQFAREKYLEGRSVQVEIRRAYVEDRSDDYTLLDSLILSHMPLDVPRDKSLNPGKIGHSITKADFFPQKNFFVTEFELEIIERADILFSKDFKDLFATLMVSLPLTPHRVRFQRVDHTFSSEEAINNLGSLKFSQSNRMPDPKDPSRIVTTTTTTTFSMAREMARSVCQRFLDARFIESADGKIAPTFPLKNGVWQLTPKGMHVLQRFCQRNGINQKHVIDVLETSRNSMQLVILERDIQSDKLSHDKATIEVIFRRFAGQDGPNVKQTASSADSDSLSDYGNGLTGVKMAKERKIVDKVVFNSFTGKATIDWLMDCCCTIDRRETCEIAKEFVLQGLVKSVLDDKLYVQHNPKDRDFQPTKAAIYILTDKGQKVAGWLVRQKSDGSDKATNGARVENKGPNTRDSNTNRLTVILSDPALRLLFREFLRDTHCEENLAFYLDVVQFTSSYRSISRSASNPKVDTIREIRESLAAAYGLYNAFLAPGSPCELNIDHNLRNNLAGRMTRAVGDDEAMSASLRDVAKLFDEAQNSVFKLMSSDSVPKFLKDPRYSSVLRDHDFDAALTSIGNAAGSSRDWSPAPPNVASKSSQ